MVKVDAELSRPGLVWVLVLGVFLGWCSCTAWADTLGAVADTCSHEAYPNMNYGDDEYMSVRHHMTSYVDRNLFIKFDLSGIPSNAVITQATLRLYQYSTISMSSGDWLKVGAYRLLKSWDEGTGGSNDGACWNYRFIGGTGPWTNIGARGVTDPPDRHRRWDGSNWVQSPDSWVECTDGVRWVEWGVTPSAQLWHGTPSQNFGMVLDTAFEQAPYMNDNDNGVEFRTREYPDDPSLRPQLVVTYYIPGAQTPVTLSLADLNLNYFNGDPNVAMSQDSGQLRCSGTTGNTTWDDDGSLTNTSYSQGFECNIKVWLQQGIVGVNHGQFTFGMYDPTTGKYIRLMAVGHGPQYYEISGNCVSSGNGEYHNGSAYWASYWDGGYPSGTPSGAVHFFSETVGSEQNGYYTWTIRYDKTNQVFLAYVNDGSSTQLVTYYTNVNFSNWRIMVTHNNDVSGVATNVWTRFPDITPPQPNPMTWATEPHPTSQTQIDMIATTATDDTPPISYYFNEVTGNPGGSSSSWQSGTSYSDTGLNPNTRYGYRVKARDSAEVPNENAYSATVYKYTLMPPPTGLTTSNVTATTVDLSATGSFPNLSEGQTGTQFETTGGEWVGSWKTHLTTDTATGLTPNTPYTFHVRSCNGDAVATAWSLGTAGVRTLAAVPSVLAYYPVSSQGIRANWGSNGNPGGTEYFCKETTTGKNSDWITNTTWAMTGFESGTPCHFYVKARNADGIETAWADLGAVQTTLSIGSIKKHSHIGDIVTFQGKIVTAVFERDRLFFIEDWPAFGNWEGVQGIAVCYPDFDFFTVNVGDVVDVTGTLAMNTPPFIHEVIVMSMGVLTIGHWMPPKPFGSCGRNLGGGDFGIQPGVWDNIVDDPPRPSHGLNVVGCFVKAWGKLTVDLPYLWIDDGCELNDGNGNYSGIRVDLTPIGGVFPPPYPRYVAVTGVMRCTTGEPALPVRVIWPRSSMDIIPYEW